MKNIKFIRIVICIILLTFFPSIILCQKTNLLPQDFIDALINEVSGIEALKHVVLLSGIPRYRSAEEYRGTFYEAQYILNKAKEYGLKDVRIEFFPWDLQNWQPITGELWLVEPEKRKLTSLNNNHLCLMQYSKDADVTAEVVDVGQGTSESDYAGKEVRGKIVLAYGDESIVNTLAVHKKGALGILSYRSFYPDDYPDMVSWGAFLHPIIKKQEKYTFGFMISPRQGHELVRLIRQGNKVIVKAYVAAQLHPGKLDVVTTAIPGREFPEEEILLMAHIFEYYYKQGANDNKSGSAVILEVARTLNQLIREGKIPPPRRTIKFFWEPEGYGTFAYLSKYPEVKYRLKSVIDMDMVGESHSKCGSIFQALVTPDSLPHFFNDVIQHLTEYVGESSGIGKRLSDKSFFDIIASPLGSRDPFYYEVVEFNPRMFNEGWLGIPHILFHCAPDPFYHSIEDRPDKCDSTQLKRVAFIGAAAAYYLANLSPEEIPELSALVLANSQERLAKEQKKALKLLSQSSKENIHAAYKEALNIIQQGFFREEKTLSSIATFIRQKPEYNAILKKLLKNDSEDDLSLLAPIKNYYSYLCRYWGLKEEEPSISSEEKRLSKIVPRRIIGLEYAIDFFYLERVLGDDKIREKLKIYQIGAFAAWEALNFADGKRSILDIRNALSAEFTPKAVTLEMVEEYLRTLEKAGVIEIAKVE